MGLHPALQETYNLVPRRGHITSLELEANTKNVSANAHINRLERLRELGLLQRERQGKVWLYSRKEGV